MEDEVILQRWWKNEVILQKWMKVKGIKVTLQREKTTKLRHVNKLKWKKVGRRKWNDRKVKC